ncbi:unnamed protein product [Penicillium salamii]|nr:unnamed protein product [Penicillium salamii]
MSDVREKRGLVVLIAISVYLVALVLLGVLQTHVDKWGKFGLWTTVNAFAVGYHPIHNAWIQINCKSAEERSISVAMFVMSATAGLMAGTQIFRGDESSSLYPRGLIIMIALVLSGLLLVVLQTIVFRVHNRRIGNAVSGKLGSTYDL